MSTSIQSQMAASSLLRRIVLSGASKGRALAAPRAIGGSVSLALFGPAPRSFAAASARCMAGSTRVSAFRSLAAAAMADDTASPSAASLESTLFVGNLPWSVDDSKLRDVFGQYNPVNCKVVTDRESGRSKGIAFVNFGSESDAQAAREALNGKEVDGRNIRVEPRTTPDSSAPRPPREPRAPRAPRPAANDERKLYVGNLAWAVDHLDLEDIFQEFGTVESAQVVRDRETGRSRGFGFVVMSTKDQSDRAKKELSGANVDGRTIVVDFASKPMERQQE